MLSPCTLLIIVTSSVLITSFRRYFRLKFVRGALMHLLPKGFDIWQIRHEGLDNGQSSGVGITFQPGCVLFIV